MRATHEHGRFKLLAIALLGLAISAGAVRSAQSQGAEPALTPAVAFLRVLLGTPAQKPAALEFIKSTWRADYIPMALDVIYLSRGDPTVAKLVSVMGAKTGEAFGFDVSQWQQWLWSQPEAVHPQYGQFKSTIYSLIDRKFAGYFADDRERTIRLDEVVWGGVHQDGIPPLRKPEMITADEATYLQDDHVVFAISVNGDVRAYPKRILAWHEMFVDEVGGVKVAGVYCTLCGTVILYETVINETEHQMGTSGFLYRSNKLMYDQATQSLWNTMWGTPVIGPLVGRGIQLKRRSVVTTTWGEWRRRHPDTKVLSLRTGHTRDYSEGAAYREYFATDRLMFKVPVLDDRLLNKDEVLGLFFRDHPDQTLAIAAKFLATKPVHHDKIGDIELVVLTDKSGANRVYDAAGLRLVSWDQDMTALDEQGQSWRVEEASLTRADGTTRARLPAHRSFWFGWFSAYPRTRLVH
ncbi:MAG: DUF3179 domain-containing protein [Gammaproteobacteria bacterium]|nr:DUF3179 domain-containing protein [Gammaproteobacteria bacterium]